MEARQQEAVEILRGAAGLIERTGLNKGDYFTSRELIELGTTDIEIAMDELMSSGEEPKCCTLGALYWTAGAVISHNTKPAVFDAIKATTGLSEEQIPEWNDRPHQRKSRVVAALRRAANHIEENASE